MVDQMAWPEFSKLVPEIARASLHRGEVPDLKHNELVPSEVCANSLALDQPVAQ